MERNNVVGLNESLKMSNVKPLVLQWCLESWLELKERKDLILTGWKKCCTQLYDVLDPQKQIEALREMTLNKLDPAFVPKEEEEMQDEEDDDSDDELDVTIPRQFGERKSTRQRTQTPKPATQICTDQIAMSEDSE